MHPAQPEPRVRAGEPRHGRVGAGAGAAAAPRGAGVPPRELRRLRVAAAEAYVPRHEHAVVAAAAKSSKKKIEEFIRVDHAGERGAVKIYEGQLLALNTLVKNEDLKKTIEEMKIHEIEK